MLLINKPKYNKASLMILNKKKQSKNKSKK